MMEFQIFWREFIFLLFVPLYSLLIIIYLNDIYFDKCVCKKKIEEIWIWIDIIKIDN